MKETVLHLHVNPPGSRVDAGPREICFLAGDRSPQQRHPNQLNKRGNLLGDLVSRLSGNLEQVLKKESARPSLSETELDRTLIDARLPAWMHVLGAAVLARPEHFEQARGHIVHRNLGPHATVSALRLLKVLQTSFVVSDLRARWNLEETAALSIQAPESRRHAAQLCVDYIAQRPDSSDEPSATTNVRPPLERPAAHPRPSKQIPGMFPTGL